MSEIGEDELLKSYDLVSDELVKEALKNDKGPKAELLRWEIIPFTKPGDNYTSVVVAIAVFYRENEVGAEHSYVAKLNPLRPFSCFTPTTEKMFAKETKILSFLVEGMNNHLKHLGLDPIKTPKLFSQNLEKEREAFILENLRIQGFKTHDKMKGMDLNHSLFVVKELGKFHASSLLFEESLPTKSITDALTGLQGHVLDDNEEGFKVYAQMLSSFGESVGHFLKSSDPKYQKCSKWLLKHAHTLPEIYANGFRPCNNQFEVVIHGDCWINNMLFRYNEDEIPVDFRFLDLQCTVKASATTDLNYFFFTSLNGDFRWNNFNTLVTSYYNSFSDVFQRAGKEPPFSYVELKQELYNQKIYGMAAAILVLQFSLAEDEDIPDVDNLSGDNVDNFTDAQMKSFERMSKRQGPFRDRYLAVFDEMLETTIFDED